MKERTKKVLVTIARVFCSIVRALIGADSKKN